jgi:hypothetical protein
VEKFEELACGTHFRGKYQFGDFGFQTFQSKFEASNGTFWGKKIVSIALSLQYCSKNINIYNGEKITSIKVHMQKLCLL